MRKICLVSLLVLGTTCVALTTMAATTMTAAETGQRTSTNADAPGDFSALAERHASATITDRRWLHSNPELSGREHQTQAYVQQQLEAIPGIRLVPGEWGTGIVAELVGGRPGALVAWRADSDALPVTEVTGLPFASARRDTLGGGREVGVMHACGHDIHLSVALGAVRILSGLRASMPGKLLLIIQPAEETGDGAAAMLAAGVFDGDRRPRCALALHDHPTLLYGQVGSCAGWASANVDGFRLVVNGQGGHGAYPHNAVDPINLAARMVLAFDDLISREIDVHTPAVITVGSIEGGAKGNVIPDAVKLQATVRTHDEATRRLVRDKVVRTVSGLAAAAGAPEPELEYFFGTPAGYNQPALVEQVRGVIAQVVGPQNDITYPPGMGGEDFSRYGHAVPGFQFRLGVGRPDQAMTLHSPDFDPDERAVVLGMRLVAEILWDQLGRPADGSDLAWEGAPH